MRKILNFIQNPKVKSGIILLILFLIRVMYQASILETSKIPATDITVIHNEYPKALKNPIFFAPEK